MARLAPPIDISPEVEFALKESRPVVALESSLICQGLPEPENLEIALSSEAILRGHNVVPATIAILEGKAHIGLSEEQIRWLAAHREISKANLANLAAILAQGQSGACTVSATLTLAARAGIQVMATGGIGGVHRDADRTFDLSSDLTALAQCPLMVVCAGAKAILALPQTLEALETLGVQVAGWKTSRLPAFYSRDSGCALELRFDSERQAVELYRAQRALDLPQGLLIGNPIPEEMEIPREEIEPWIEQALQQARRENIQGKALTPFLLSRLKQLSGNRTLRANLALIENNVRLAAALAREMA
jgi:pseudouridine-5'-phosphate glycosidase